MQERIYLGRNRIAARQSWGGWIVAPGFNLDVAVGAIRDAAIEPWTTRLVQEMLKPGDVYLNAGGNFGYYAALGGSIVGPSGKVVVVEPNPHIFPFLMETTMWSGVVAWTRVVKRALDQSAGRTLNFAFDPQYLGGGAAVRGGLSGIVRASIDDAIWSHANIDEMLDEKGVWVAGTGQYIEFSVKTTTIDDLCNDLPPLKLIHLDIEGSEPFALKGAMHTIERSPQMRLITEWSGAHYAHGSEEARACFDTFAEFSTRLGFRARQLIPRIGDQGSISVSPVLTLEHMRSAAEHGDYVWIKAEHDYW